MKKSFLLFCFILSLFPVFSQDYNNLEKEYQDYAAQALAKLSPATKQWFETIVKTHPDGNFNADWSKSQLNTKFTRSQMNEMGEMFVVMMAYLKMVQKEAREDRKIQRMSKEISISATEKKLEADNKSIEQGQKEAGIKSSNAMKAANTQVASGVSSGTIQASPSGTQTTNSVSRTRTNSGNPTRQFKSSDSLQKQMNTQEQSKNVNTQQTSQTTADRKKASLDNLQKMLDILRSMNPKL